MPDCEIFDQFWGEKKLENFSNNTSQFGNLFRSTSHFEAGEEQVSGAAQNVSEEKCAEKPKCG